MTEQMLYDRMSQMIRVGFVNARQPEKMRVKVTLNDTVGSPLVTDWLPVLCPRACGDMQYDLPDIGDQVLCLFLAYGLEQGFVLGSMYGRQTPPVSSGDKWHRTFSDGATLEYDRAAHSLTANIPGTANIKCSRSITLEAPTVFIRGRLINTNQEGNPGNSIFSGGMEVMNGGINVMDGDVIASGVSLTSHTTDGVKAGSDTSSHPTGGSSESAGTSAKPIPAYGTAEYATWIATHILAIQEKVKNSSSPSKKYDELIACLPDILEHMAMVENDEDKQKGILYLKGMLEKWLAIEFNKKGNNSIEPFWVDWDWAIKFFPTQRNYNEFVDKNLQEGTIYSYRAMQSLGKILCENGMLDSEKEEIVFDFIDTNGDDWKEWENTYFTLKAIEAGIEEFIDPSGLYIAMGDFSLRALAAGTAKNLGNNAWQITLKKVGIFVHDNFNFEDKWWIPDAGEKKLPLLGFWSCKYKDAMKKLPAEGYLGLHNLNFQHFQENQGYGASFLVLSLPHIIDNTKEVSYKYVCKK